MEFNDLCINKIDGVISYTSNKKRWNSVNRKNHILGIQLSGSVLHTLEAKTLLLSENCVFFLNQKDDYAACTYEPGESLSVHFTTTENISTDSFCIDINDTTEIASYLKKLKYYYETGNNLLSKSLLYEICAKLQALCEKSYFHKDKRIIELKKFIDVNYGEKDLLKTVISMSNLSSRRFTDLFKKHYNMTPNRYITLHRINIAKSLLKTNIFSIADVAERCGFHDVYYFSNVFKKETGVSPGKYYQIITSRDNK